MSNKFKQLTAKTAKLGVTALIIVGSFGGLYAGILFYSGNVEKQKTEADSKLSSEEATFNNLRSQMDKSGEAEKRFATLQASRISTEYAINKDGFTDWLKNSKAQYHLDRLRLTPAAEVPTDKAELTSFNYKISLRPRIGIDFSAFSDLHVFSFLDQLASANSGFMRVDRLEIRRKGDLDDSVIRQMHDSGVLTPLVDAKIQVTNIGISKVDTKDAKDAKPGSPGAPAAGAAGASSPPVPGK